MNHPSDPVSRGSALVVCGPTACGKSELSDFAADLITDRYSSYSPVIVVDSMQVYKEIPKITNQARRRPAELTGIVSVLEEWTMVRHREACDAMTCTAEAPFVMDAGTGMYLNSILLDVPIAPQVPKSTRARAEAMTVRASNPRRASREKELELSGAEKTGSIWEGTLRYEFDLIYIRPDRSAIDAAIEARSSKISREGPREVQRLLEDLPEAKINHSVKESIGVRELIAYSKGKLTLEEVEHHINVRTRRLARRQMRWFDKLSGVISDRADVTVADTLEDAQKAVQRRVVGL